MKIVFCTISLKFGGAERCMTILANEFVKNGHEVYFILESNDPSSAYLLNEHIQCHPIGEIRFNKIHSFVDPIKKMRNILEDIMPDVIVSFFSNTAVFGWIAQMGLNIPIVFSERNDPQKNETNLTQRIFRAITKHIADYIVFQTEGARTFYGSRIFKKSTIILNPFEPLNITNNEGRPQNKIISSVGRLTEQKNQILIINAFSRIHQFFPDYKLIIWGDGPLRTKLEEQISMLGLSEKVLLPGTSPSVLNEISDSSLFVLSSDYEGLPNALIEAMCIGIPCISTDCSPGGARELILNNKNGLIVPCNNIDALSEAIKYLLSNPDIARKMGSEAKNIYNRVSVSSIAKQWLDIFESLL